MKESFRDTDILRADQLAMAKRAEVELLSGIESGFRIENQAMLRPLR